jgi:MYXO-CTERM domain-containing protein
VATGGAGGSLMPDAAPDLAPGTGGSGIIGGFLGADGAIPTTTRDDLVGGCACRAGGRAGGTSWWLVLMAAPVVWRRRRR